MVRDIVHLYNIPIAKPLSSSCSYFAWRHSGKNTVRTATGFLCGGCWPVLGVGIPQNRNRKLYTEISDCLSTITDRWIQTELTDTSIRHETKWFSRRYGAWIVYASCRPDGIRCRWFMWWTQYLKGVLSLLRASAVTAYWSWLRCMMQSYSWWCHFNPLSKSRLGYQGTNETVSCCERPTWKVAWVRMWIGYSWVAEEYLQTYI